MKILYDHQIFDRQKRGGVSRYFYILIDGIKKISNTVVELPLLHSENIYISGKTTGISFLRKIWKKMNRFYSIQKLKGQDFDLFHPTYFDAYFLKYIGKKPFVITIYDMTHEIYPDLFSSDNTTSHDKKILSDKASKIISISHNTKKDIVKYLGISPGKVEVIHLGDFFSDIKAESVSIPSKYILFVGNRKKYKNFTLFMESVSIIMKEDPEIQIVCVGDDSFNKEEMELLLKLEVEKRVTQKNVSDGQLSYLYSNAHFFVFPSLYEGFGLPILEAFACKCPIAISNTSCFPEIAGDAALYFDPNNQNSMVEALRKMNTDKQLRLDLVKKGTERLKNFSKEKMIQDTYNIYKQCINP